MANNFNSQFKVNGVVGILVLVAFFIALFYISKAIFFVLSWVAPLLLVAAFIINKSVVINYGKWIVNLFKKNPLYGIGAALFTLIGYMLVFPFLFAKALFKKKINEVAQEFEKRTKGESVDIEYEEISSQPKIEETLELPRLDQRKQKQQRSDYDQMFD